MKFKEKVLYDLIHSLTPHEKGYFTKYIRASPGKSSERCVALFGVIDAMPHYDSAALSEMLRDKGIDGQTARLGHYLYNVLLDCLAHYHREASADLQMLDLLRKAQLLIGRGLADQSRAVLRKATALAEEYHRPLMVMEAQRLLSHVLRPAQSETETSAMDTAVGKLLSTSYAYHHGMKAYQAYLSMVVKTRKGESFLAHAGKADFIAYFQSATESIDEEGLDHSGHINLQLAKYAYALGLNDQRLTVIALQSLKDMFGEVLHIPGNLRKWFTVCYNLANVLLELRQFDEATTEVAELVDWYSESIATSDLDADGYYGIMTHLLQLILLAKSPSHLNDRLFAARVYGFLNKRMALFTIGQRLTYYLSTASYYLLSNRPTLALPAINEVINNARYQEVDLPNTVEAELLNIFAHAQLGNYELMFSLIARMRRGLKDRPALPHARLVTAILGQMQLLPDQSEGKERKAWKLAMLALLDAQLGHDDHTQISLEFDYVRYFRDVF